MAVALQFKMLQTIRFPHFNLCSFTFMYSYELWDKEDALEVIELQKQEARLLIEEQKAADVSRALNYPGGQKVGEVSSKPTKACLA